MAGYLLMIVGMHTKNYKMTFESTGKRQKIGKCRDHLCGGWAGNMVE